MDVYRSQHDLVIAILSEMAHTPLRAVSVRMRHFPDISRYPHIDIASTIDWHRLGTVLASLRCSSLEVVEYITVVEPFLWSGAQAYWEALVQTHLPHLHSKGLFQFANADDNLPSFWV